MGDEEASRGEAPAERTKTVDLIGSYKWIYTIAELSSQAMSFMSLARLAFALLDIFIFDC